MYKKLPDKVTSDILTAEYVSVMGEKQLMHYYKNGKLKFEQEVLPRAYNAEKIIYFKINRNSTYAIHCIQNWVDVANMLNYDYYFICDNNELKREVLKSVNFHNTDIKFIPSMRDELKDINEIFYTGRWKYATFAHLTAFYHAKKIGINKVWMIDADDTQFMLNPYRISQILQTVELESEQKHYHMISLDMWRSRTAGRHWTFGIAYMNSFDFCRIFEMETKQWMEFEQLAEYNLDWYFSYLKLTNVANIVTFYVNNCYFIHWGNMLTNPIGSSIMFWHDSRVTYPILDNILEDHEMGDIPIADCICIDIGSSKKECLDQFKESLLGVLGGFKEWISGEWRPSISDNISSIYGDKHD